MRPFTPHTVRHGASRPLSPVPPAMQRRQGKAPTRPGALPTLALYLARGLAVMALVGINLLTIAVLL